MTAGHSCVSEDMKEILFTQRLDHLYPASAELLVAEFSKLFLNLGYKGGERERGGSTTVPSDSSKTSRISRQEVKGRALRRSGA